MTIHRLGKDLYVEDLKSVDIAQQFGTPCYVYSANTIKDNFLSFDRTFDRFDHLVCYAVKANSNLSVIQLLAKLGSGFDIVSGGELERVLISGGDPKKIVFSGVGKNHQEIARALAVGIKCFNVESVSELKRISTIASELNQTAPISLRVNPNVDAKTHPYISTGLKENKFGVEIENALDIYQHAKDLPCIEPIGIDCHIGSQLTQLAPMREAAEIIIDLADKLASTGIRVKHIDFGGGLGISYKDEVPASRESFVSMLCEVMRGRHEEIIIEPGRSIVGDAGVLLTRVEYVKEGPHKNFIVVDAAMNDLARPSLYDAYHRIEKASSAELGDARSHQTYDVVGPICETGDFLGTDRSLDASEGDVLAIHSAGAYGMTMSSNYNTRPRAAEVLVDRDTCQLIRSRETLDDLIAPEKGCLK